MNTTRYRKYYPTSNGIWVSAVRPPPTPIGVRGGVDDFPVFWGVHAAYSVKAERLADKDSSSRLGDLYIQYHSSQLNSSVCSL